MKHFILSVVASYMGTFYIAFHFSSELLVMERNIKASHELKIAEKLKLIADSNICKLSQRRLALKYKISKSQVQRILKNKEDLKKNQKNGKRLRVNRKFS